MYEFAGEGGTDRWLPAPGLTKYHGPGFSRKPLRHGITKKRIFKVVILCTFLV